MAWTIILSPQASKQLAKFPKDHQKQIRDSIERMKADPFQGNVKPLKGKQWQGRYRMKYYVATCEHKVNLPRVIRPSLRS